MPTNNQVAKKGGTDISADVIDFGADAGAGMETADSDSFAIPFLKVLQSNSPQVDEASGEAIEGAKAGMIYDTISGKMVPGKDGVLIVPCAFQHRFIRWAPRGSDEGFKGELLPEEVSQLRIDGKIAEMDRRSYFVQADGTIDDRRCDKLSDVRNHFCLLIDEETGQWSTVLLSLTSTQIKKSKMLMTILNQQKIETPNGTVLAPTFANIIRMTTVAESNDQGKWFGVQFKFERRVDNKAMYEDAKSFHALVASGEANVKYEEQPATPVQEESDAF